jgi:NAD(P)H dehydrogenase (quinone)
LARLIAQGAEEAGAAVDIRQVPEIVPEEALAASGALEARKAFSDIPMATIAELPEYDGFAFGSPTRFGAMSATLRSFLEQAGGLWQQGRFCGKAGTAFSGSGTGCGHEAAIIGFWPTLSHLGMVIVSPGYVDQKVREVSELHGASAYGAAFISKAAQPRPSAIEASVARTQGRLLADVARRLSSPVD